MISLRYPFRLSSGAPESATGEEIVVSAINQLFAQDRGERVYDSTNGVSLTKYVFENNDSLLRANLRREITLALNRNEPRSELISAPVRTFERDNKSVLVEVTVLWRYRGRVYSLARSVTVER